jgi:hypothetical protein
MRGDNAESSVSATKNIAPSLSGPHTIHILELRGSDSRALPVGIQTVPSNAVTSTRTSGQASWVLAKWLRFLLSQKCEPEIERDNARGHPGRRVTKRSSTLRYSERGPGALTTFG